MKICKIFFIILCFTGCLCTGYNCIQASLQPADELYMFPGSGTAQNLSVLIKTEHGRLIVIDGGWREDAGALAERIRENGGTVAAWFLTHPHADHAGALAALLEDPSSGIVVEKIYCSLAEPEWYQNRAPEDPGMADQLLKDFLTFPEGTADTGIGKGDRFQIDDAAIEVMNDRGDFKEDPVNNSCIVYKFQLQGQSILFLGDLGYQAGEALLKDQGSAGLRADVVQMAHHGQGGVGRDIYEAISPRICLWPTPQWLWDNDSGGGRGTGPWSTLETRRWMEELGVKEHKCTKDGVIHMHFSVYTSAQRRRI